MSFVVEKPNNARCVIPKMTQKHNNKIPGMTFLGFNEFLRYFDAANYFFYHQSYYFYDYLYL